MITLRFRHGAWFKNLLPRPTCLVLPERVTYVLISLANAQWLHHERLEDAVTRGGHFATWTWRNATGRRFGNRYEVLYKIFVEEGGGAVLRALWPGGSPRA
jgi:hypothetical protein